MNRLPDAQLPARSPTRGSATTFRSAAPRTGGVDLDGPAAPVTVPTQAVRPEPPTGAALRAEAVVIGAGPAGMAAAEGIAAGAVTEDGSGRVPAGRRPLRVVVVDEAPAGQGGWSGRLALAALHEAAARGWSWSQAGAYLREVRADVVARHEARLAALQARLGPQVLLLSGRARLSGHGQVRVEPRGAEGAGPQVVSARRVVLATGCVPALPEVTGLVDTSFLTATEVAGLLDADRPPASVAVLGAGSTGCALAQALARLGVGVTLVDEHPGVLAGADEDAAALVAARLQRDGVRLLLGSPVMKVAPTLDGGAWLGIAAGADVAAERLVVAVGWRAATGGLDLPSAGVTVGPAGAVTVDPCLVTRAPEVLAAGGVVAGEPHAGAALAMGAVAGANAVSRRPTATWSAAAVATLTLTDPEVAVVGTTDPGWIRAGRSAGGAVGVGTVPWSEVDRAVLSGIGDGFVRVVVAGPGSGPGSRPGAGHGSGSWPGSGSGPGSGPRVGGGRWIGRRSGSGTVRVIGATVVGSRAGDLVAPLALAIGTGLPASALAATVSADPTWSSALRTAVARACADLP